ncbi:MAG TPA: tetratricopeptide repeat protein [Candidatus Hydrogenedentes bacterium]|nr:tetratricopeptide repeat protein [Candidatus Hydrogenedentota bacterium]HOT49359.1 tetratricopeptide repeat protein [Candidatus Hydrogenedentota bacterium]HOV75514.1 tetratricopeptide repeat protein [Candidatus Hydrogenedentota bacterium]HPC18164.1 tetratricopeptide repeat protein [Candidatus Hydrogenedentota bacterium]HRT20377.1 tetratricopeptide repeat protein [Candidatus Hydrogenedentota bacterium]
MRCPANRHGAYFLIALCAVCGCNGGWREGLAALMDREATMAPPPRSEAYSRFLAGTLYERKGQRAKAIAEMRAASDLAPDSVALSIQLIRFYLDGQDYANARMMAERALQQAPGNANLWILLGEILHQSNDPEKAIECFQKALEIDPENALGYGALVSAQETANDAVGAAEIYRGLAKRVPDSPGIQFQLGLSLARINDGDGARAALQRALELKPDLVRAHYIIGVIELDANRNEQAAEHLAQYVAAAPDDARARENHAGALARLKRYGDAADQMIAVLGMTGAEPRHYLEAMYLLMRAGRHRQADEFIPPEGAPILGSFLRALARKGMGEPYLPVLESLDAIESDAGEECVSHLNEMMTLFGKEDMGSWLAAALAETGFAGRTTDIILGRVYLAMDRNEEAEKVLLGALDQYGSDPAIHYTLAIVYDNLKRLPDTEKHLKACLEIRPDDPEILNFLGYLYADHNINLDEAEKLLKRAVELDPGSGYYLDSLGWVYYRRGQADKAIELIRKAILLMDSDDAELRNHLGDAYLLKGDTARALAEWRHAEQLNPKLPGLREKIEKHLKQDGQGETKPGKGAGGQ